MATALRPRAKLCSITSRYDSQVLLPDARGCGVGSWLWKSEEPFSLGCGFSFPGDPVNGEVAEDSWTPSGRSAGEPVDTLLAGFAAPEPVDTSVAGFANRPPGSRTSTPAAFK